MSNLPILDLHGRSLRYLRLSVTDRCNLSCSYCVNSARQKYIPHKEILRYEELLRLVKIFKSLGVKKTRLTGGEPLVRKGLLEFMAKFRKTLPEMKLAITTNAILLPTYLEELATLGLESFNISLDTFQADTFLKLTGKNALNSVLNSIDRLLMYGQKVKLNAVAIKGITDLQIADYVQAIRNMPVELRFIEYMPMGANTGWDSKKFLSADTLKAQIAQMGQLTPIPNNDIYAGPAQLFQFKGAKGRFGFISALSHHFCNLCQRMRITSNGNLRLCLFGDEEVKLAPLLRHPKLNDKHIRKTIIEAYKRKPLGMERLQDRKQTHVAKRQMVGIGG